MEEISKKSQSTSGYFCHVLEKQKQNEINDPERARDVVHFWHRDAIITTKGFAIGLRSVIGSTGNVRQKRAINVVATEKTQKVLGYFFRRN